MIDWDLWRAEYDRTGYDEQLAFYDRVWQQHPVQNCHSESDAAAFLDHVLEHRMEIRVVEIGGWRGELADAMLRRHPVNMLRSWRNIEVCRGAANAPVSADPRYNAIVPRAWLWEDPQWLDGATVLVAGDVIEHMRSWQLERLLDLLPDSITFAYIASPLEEGGRDWAGYQGSHILEVGWSTVVAMFASAGFSVCGRGSSSYWFERPAPHHGAPDPGDLFGGPPE